MWIYVIAAVIIFILLKELIRLPTVGKYGERYVFITGCDSGFGNQLAKHLDSLGFNVFAACYTEKGEDELRKVSSEKLQTLMLDVSKTESIVKAREIVEKYLPAKRGLWAIVNNAGINGSAAPSEMLTRAEYQECFAVNLYGVIDVSRIFLPLIRTERGRVVNISSAGGRLAFNAYPYCCSKFGVEAFSDCLRREVLKQGITVHILEPGHFKTGMNNVDNIYRDFVRCYDRSSEDVKEYYGRDLCPKMREMMEKYVSFANMNTQPVVDAYTHAITAMFPRPRYIVGNDAKYLFRTLWNLPEWLSDFLLTVAIPAPEGEKRK